MATRRIPAKKPSRKQQKVRVVKVLERMRQKRLASPMAWG